MRLFRLRASPRAQPQRKNGSEQDLGRLLGMIQDLLSTYLRVLVLPKNCHCRVKVRAPPPPLLQLPLHPRRSANQTAPGRYKPGAKQEQKKQIEPGPS